jgi:Flp pilus assembly protein TadB
MKRIVGLFVAWLIAAVMLTVAVIGPPAANSRYIPRTSRPEREDRAGNRSRDSRRSRAEPDRSRSHSYARSYSTQRKDFYTFLRWVCCAAFAYSAITAFQMKRVAWVWIFAILAVLFNPIAPFYLQRGTWQVIDWSAIGVIILAAFLFWRERKRFGIT